MVIDLAFAADFPEKRSLARAADLVNYAQNATFVRLTEIPADILSYHENRPDLVVFREAADLVRAHMPGRKVVYVTHRPFDNNYFSDTHGDVAIVTTDEWSEKFAPPSVAAYVAREIALSFICFSGDLPDEDIDRISMVPSNGCIFDFCANKVDVRFGLVSGYIHPETAAKLRRYGILDDTLVAAERILELIRLEAIGRPARIEPREAFVVMKFSDRDENANAYEYGVKPALEAFGLVPTRADDDPQMRTLSEKVADHIRECRLVVIKVDEPNLNVFFELGYAIALKKDVLLVCEQNRLPEMPSDIKGWELLTYPAGDYESLRTRTTSYLGNLLPHRHI